MTTHNKKPEQRLPGERHYTKEQLVTFFNQLNSAVSGLAVKVRTSTKRKTPNAHQ